jgi:hypothetical protein
VSDSSSADPSQAPPELEDPAERATISAQLAELIPEVRKLRRSRWLTRVLALVVVAVIALGAAGAIQYVQDRNDDREQRIERRAGVERALAAECESSADQTADMRTAIQVILTTAIARSSNPAEAEAIAKQINRQLDEDVPPRDCAQEARDRAQERAEEARDRAEGG